MFQNPTSNGSQKSIENWYPQGPKIVPKSFQNLWNSAVLATNCTQTIVFQFLIFGMNFCISISGYAGRFLVQNCPPGKKYFQVFSPFLVLSPCFFAFSCLLLFSVAFYSFGTQHQPKNNQKIYDAQRTPDQKREAREASPTSHATSSTPRRNGVHRSCPAVHRTTGGRAVTPALPAQLYSNWDLIRYHEIR